MAEHKPTLVIDVDGLLAGPKPESGYADCEVNELVAQRLRDLRALGWTITISTSRGVRTHDSNLGAIIAHTVPVLVAWLERHNVPFDELVPGKPWTGSIGFYVDDRAVRPQEFIELTTSELLAQSRASVYDPAKPAWRVGNEQSWFAADLRENPSTLFRGDLIAVISDRREVGQRCALILPADVAITPGQDEELRRLGTRWWRFERGLPPAKLLSSLQRELVLDNLTQHTGLIELVSPEPRTEELLSSRHFNTVRAHGGRVVKSAKSDTNRRKLQCEIEWLLAASTSLDDLTMGELAERPNGFGYTMAHASGGALSTTLLRRDLSNLDVTFIRQEIERLWEAMSTLKTLKRLTVAEQLSEYNALYVIKSRDRVNTLSRLLQEIGAGDCNNYRWTVNGTEMGTVYATVQRLLLIIPPALNTERGLWHGDFYPGNMVLTEDVSHDETSLRLIDPRGTLNGTDLALIGDRRYDLGKLGHALRWGYDALVAGWDDVQWRADVGHTDVRLRLWDEESNVRPARLRLWDELGASGVVRVGDVKLDDPLVTAISALQLITCAPIHKEDPKRMMALIARGMAAAAQVGVK